MKVSGVIIQKRNISVDTDTDFIATYKGKEISVEMYSRDVASFFTWWTHFVHEDLNGFSGFSNLKFELIGFKVV